MKNDLTQSEMLIDAGLSMGMIAFTKICSDKEINDFFKVWEKRFIRQGFSSNKVDMFIKETKQMIIDLKHEKGE